MLTTFGEDSTVYEALRAGASGFLLKDSERRHLLQAIRVIASGDEILDPTITRRLIEEMANRVPAVDGVPGKLAHLSAREVEVMSAVARGLSNREIAGRAGAVRAHREVPRGLDPQEARRPRPDAGGDRGLRDRPRHPGRCAWRPGYHLGGHVTVAWISGAAMATARARARETSAPTRHRSSPGTAPTTSTSRVIVAVGPRHRRRVLLFPDFAVKLKPLGDGLRRPDQDDDPAGHLLHDRARRRLGRQAAKVGKVGGLALGYFLTMSTVALAIGLVVGNILKPGEGLDLDECAASAGQAAGRGGPRQHHRLPARHHPRPRCSRR